MQVSFSGKQFSLLKILLLAVPATHAVQLDDTRVRLDLGFEDGSAAPELFIPVRWSNHYFSGLGFNSGTTQTNDEFEGFTDSRIAIITDDTSYRINLVSYEISPDATGWTFGIDLYNLKTDKLEFGFFQMPDPYAPNPAIAGEYVTFENDVNIDILHAALTAAYTFRSSSLDARLTIDLVPQFNLDLQQRLSVKPLIASTGTYSGSSKQDAAYKLGIESLFKISEMIHFGIDAGYEFIALDYAMPGLNDTLDAFTTMTIDEDIATTHYALRLVINKPYGNLKPVIGLLHESTETTDNLTSSSVTAERDIFVLGLENRF